MRLSALQEKSIGSYIISSIIEMASDLNKISILDSIEIHGRLDKDGSIIVSLEWNGHSGQDEALDFFNKIKSFIVKTGKETKEQEPPVLVRFINNYIVSYRFRIWDMDGKYDTNEKILVSN